MNHRLLPPVLAVLALAVSLGAQQFTQSQVAPFLPCGAEPAVADFDGDGNPELAVLNGTQVLLVDPDLGYATRLVANGPSSSRLLAAADVDRDGDVDLVISADGELRTLRNLGFGAFATGPGPIPAFLQNLRLADVDGDGIVDAIGYAPASRVAQIAVCRGLGAYIGAGFASPTYSPTWSGAVDLRVGDVDGDGHTDVVTLLPSDALVLHRGSASGLTAPTIQPLDGWRAETMAVGDFDGNGIDDLVCAFRGTSDVQVVFGGPSGLRLGPRAFSGNGSPPVLAVADFDADGLDDVVVGIEDENYFHRNDGSGYLALTDVLTFATRNPDPFLATADFDLDGDPDVLSLGSTGELSDNRDATGNMSSPFGTGTAGCLGTVTLATVGPATIPNPTFRVRAANAPRRALGVLLLSDASTNGTDPLQLGITLYVDLTPGLTVTPFAVLSSGTASASLPIPNVPALSGTTFTLQGLWLDGAAGQGCSPASENATTSRGVSVTIV